MASPKSISHSTITLTIISFVGIFLNLANQIIIAYYFGTTPERDAYFIAVSIPLLINLVFKGSFSTVLMPYIFKNRYKSQTTLNQFISQTFVFSSLLLLIIAISVVAFSGNIVSNLAPGLETNQFNTSVKLLRILIPSILFNGITQMLTILYQSDKKFFRQALPNIIIIIVNNAIVILFNKQYGIYSLAAGFLIGNIVALIFLTPILKKYKFDINLKLIKQTSFIPYLWAVFPLFVMGFIFRSENIIERYFASRLPAGSISYLGYSDQIIKILTSLTAAGIVTSIAPLLTDAFQQTDTKKLRSIWTQAFRFILFASGIIGVVLFTLSTPLTQLFFERGAFDHGSTLQISHLLKILVPSLLFYCIGTLTAKGFYLSGRTYTFTIIAIVSILIHVLFSGLLVNKFEIKGLAYAKNIATGTNILMSSIILHKLFKIFDFKNLLIFIAKLSMILCTVYFALSYTQNIISNEFSLIVQLIFQLIVLTIIIFATSRLLKIEELDSVINKIRVKINLKK